jgi:hypothetical protein
MRMAIWSIWIVAPFVFFSCKNKNDDLESPSGVFFRSHPKKLRMRSLHEPHIAVVIPQPLQPVGVQKLISA